MTKMMFGRAGIRVALLALCTVALGAIPMVAQDSSAPPPPPQDGGGHPMGRGGPRQRQERQLEMMTKQLNLTPDQVSQIKAIYSDTDKQMMALRDDTSAAQADRREKMMVIRRDSQAKIRAVLTDEQKTKYDAMMAMMRERREQRTEPQPN
jgi:periplasmic protein CpxP/Spy